VAKVVIRGWIWSQELLDFFIFLSPSDVWCGTLKWDADLGTVLCSSDDSIQTAPCLFDAVNNPIKEPLKAITCALNEEWMGYIEVYNNWSKLYGPPFGQVINKVDICNAFFAEDVMPDNPPRDILTGHYEQLFAGATTAADVPTVLANYNIQTRLLLGQETFLGENAINNICEVEAVLSKEQEYKYFYNKADKYAIHWNTLPTKVTQIDENCVLRDPAVKGPFFVQHGELRNALWCFEFTYNYWDWFENDPDPDNPLFSPTPKDERWWKCLEVEPFFTEPPFIKLFDEGWVSWTMGQTVPPAGVYATVCAAFTDPWQVIYTGAPVIDTIWFVGPYGLSILPGAWKDGTVLYDDGAGGAVLLPFYQYFTAIVESP
jgi:hypothetical protein